LIVRAALLLLALLPALGAQACPAGASHPIASLKELPQELLNVLGRFDNPRPRIADIGEKFNASDVVFADSAPQRRLVAGSAAQNCVELKVEFGGIGYRTELVEFQNTDRGWALVRGGYDNPVIQRPAAEAPAR
jgi:hypothetical protein